MDTKLQTELFDRDDVNTIEDFKNAVNGEENKIYYFKNDYLTFNPQHQGEHQWVFQFGDSEPIPFYLTFSNMINPTGQLQITCNPSDVTHLEFRDQDKRFKIFSRRLN